MGRRPPTRAGRALISLLAVAALLTATFALLAGSARAGDSEEPTAQLRVSVDEAQPGETITVEGSGFRVETEGSFIYSSTITIGSVPIGGVTSVDPASGFLHLGRTTDTGLWVAEHIDIDPSGTPPDGAFTATFVLPEDLPAGDHELVAISCWAGPDGDYPEDGVAPCGIEGLGGGVKDRVATATLTIIARSAGAPVAADTGNAGPGIERDSGVPASVVAFLVVAIAGLAVRHELSK
ncbi:MAG: hypothetical protein OXE43_08655 [Chloroflexi bacterium]|nr:hypothetical protein [Chloroflexota bacterium]